MLFNSKGFNSKGFNSKGFNLKGPNTMGYKSLIFIGLLVTFQSACSHSDSPMDNSIDTISVSGLGEVEVKSDQATLYLEVGAEHKKMAMAKSQADSYYQALLDLLSENGLSTDDLTLTQLNMNPMYEWQTVDGNSRRFQTGYRVSRSLNFELNDLEKLPALLEGLASATAIQINSVNRGIQDPSAVIEQATAKAITDAKRRAEFIAKQFDRDLGDVKTVEAQHSDVPFTQESSSKVMSDISGMRSSAPDEYLGTKKITASINVVFKLD
jgi:hypothetical protein